MKSFAFLGSIALLALSAGSAALAADLPVKAPVYRTLVAAPYYDWTGFYVGGLLGYSWGHNDRTTSNAATGAVVSTGGHDQNGGFGGGQIGYNYMAAPNLLLGFEADVAYANITGSETITNAAGTNVSVLNVRTDRQGTVRGRIGYAANGWLLYATGGWAWAHAREDRAQVAGTTGLSTPGTVESVNFSKSGGTVGGGVEFAVAPNWSVKGEYRYIDYGTDPAFARAMIRSDLLSREHQVLVGLNYRLNWAPARFGGKY
jgi:outer membrane autotransporter protein